MRQAITSNKTSKAKQISKKNTALKKKQSQVQQVKLLEHKNVRWRGIFIFCTYFSLVILVLVFNFTQYKKINTIHDFEYWGMFFFAVYLLFAWKNKAKNWFVFLVKGSVTFLVFAFLMIFIALPIISPKHHPNPEMYNGFGIFIFSLAWFIEMFLFWTSENEKN